MHSTADQSYGNRQIEQPERRLSDLIARAFFQAHRAGDLDTAGHLLNGLESLTKRERELYPRDRRQGIAPLDDAKAQFIVATTDITQRSAENGYVM